MADSLADKELMDACLTLWSKPEIRLAAAVTAVGIHPGIFRPAHLIFVPLLQCSSPSDTSYVLTDARPDKIGPRAGIGSSCASQKTAKMTGYEADSHHDIQTIQIQTVHQGSLISTLCHQP